MAFSSRTTGGLLAEGVVQHLNTKGDKSRWRGEVISPEDMVENIM